MKPLTTIELLGYWENYMHYPPVERALYLLSAVYDADVDTVAAMSIGERDARLLDFREWLFGPRLLNIARCPQCEKPTEWETEIQDIRLQEILPAGPAKIFHLDADGYKIDFRLPNSYDIIRTFSKPTNATEFISGCIINIEQKDKGNAGTVVLSQEIVAGISRRMNEEDPQADIKMVLTCPDCDHQWEASFDILDYLWIEIDSLAKRVLKEVAVLARAFGWNEREILQLSPQRRQLYLELANR